MKNHINFYKRICSIAVSSLLLFGYSVSGYATDLDSVPSDVIENAADETDLTEVDDTSDGFDAEEIDNTGDLDQVETADTEDNSDDFDAVDINDANESSDASDTLDTEDIEEDSDTVEAVENSVSGENSVEEESADPAETDADENIDDETDEADNTDDTYDFSEYTGSLLMIDPDPTDDYSAEGSAEGNGGIMITTIKRPKNVISMVVPVLDSNTYDFILDPDGLLSLNPENTIIGGDSTVFFKSSESDNTYSIFSDVANAVNKSNVPVMLSVELTVKNETGATLEFTDLNGVNNADSPSICFAIIPTEFGTVEGDEVAVDGIPVKSEMAITDAEGKASKELLLPGTPENFEIVTRPTEDLNFYVQEYKVIDDPVWPTVGFTLYGACSRNTDWSELAAGIRDGGSLTLTITYEMSPVIDTEEEEIADEI